MGVDRKAWSGRSRELEVVGIGLREHHNCRANGPGFWKPKRDPRFPKLNRREEKEADAMHEEWNWGGYVGCTRFKSVSQRFRTHK